MATQRNRANWPRCVPPILFVCAALVYGNLDTQGVTRQFISKINHDCRDFKVVQNKCQVWKDMGFCFKYRRQMQHVCNRTCQYCIPGQKQWEVVDRVWGRVRESSYQPESTHALPSSKEHNGPVIQILGKERTPQVDDAAIAIANQLDTVPSNEFGKTMNATSKLGKAKVQSTPRTSPDITGKTQRNPSIKKPSLHVLKGKQVTVTVNEKPETGEATVRMQSSPKDVGVSYLTDRTPGRPHAPKYFMFHEFENDEMNDRSYEEEAKIREATRAIKTVMKLFDVDSRRGHMRNRLVKQAAYNSPADSKSIGTDLGMLRNQSAIEAQVKAVDHADARTQTVSQQIEQRAKKNEKVPNFAVISSNDSGDWKSLARVLAIQLKRVLNHMEHREKESRYEKQKIQEEMMLMEQQQMMNTDDDNYDDAFDDDYDDDDDDDEMPVDGEKRRQSVLNPAERNNSENVVINKNFNDKQPTNVKSAKKIDESKLVNRSVQKLLKLEMLQKLRGELQILSS